MKKTLPLILIVGILLVGTPVSATILSKNIQFNKVMTLPSEKIDTKNLVPNLFFDGNFTGWFGIENDVEDYDVLGYIEGYYIHNIGLFFGQWNMTDDIFGGYMIGFFRSNSLFGWVQIGLKKVALLGPGLPFFGVYQINETTHEFTAEIIRFIFPNLHICCQFCKFEE